MQITNPVMYWKPSFCEACCCVLCCVQGASEIVLERCVSYFDETGAVVSLTSSKKEEILAFVTEMASKGLRTIGLAYTDFPSEDPTRPATFFDNAPDNNLILMAIVGIKVSKSSFGRFEC